MRQILFVALVALIIPATAGAATILVPSEQPTIQEGINAAGQGDTVLVAPDTYTGALNRDLDFGGTNIVVVSESGPGETIIACDEQGRGFFFHSGEDTSSVVRGFTIAAAVADTGAGAYCVNGSSPRFEECTFTDNTAQVTGGGLCCNASSPIVRDCEISLNLAVGATRDNGYGGGMTCLFGSSPLIVDTDFFGNDAYGGGDLYSRLSSPQLLRCGFMGNQLGDYGHGAGAALQQSDGTTLTECRFLENGVPNCSGGGMYVDRSTTTVTDCVFADNIAGASGGMHMTGESTSTLSGCTFVGNTGAWGGTGGALQCLPGATSTITNCTFVDNGPHHVVFDQASPTLEYCIMVLSRTGLPVVCAEETATPSIHHCFVFGNADGDSLCGGNYHDNEYVDPLLCDWEHDDVTLCADSPCLPGATWASLVGAEGEGCEACGTAVDQSTWGRIKATYR